MLHADFSINFAENNEPVMQRITVAEAQTICLGQNIPFYSYRLPGKSEACFGAQVEGEVAKFEHMGDVGGAEGFVAVPFQEDVNVPSLFIRGDVVFRESTDDWEIIEQLTSLKPKEEDSRIPVASVSRREYRRQVTAMITALQKGDARKLVLARGLVVTADGYRQAAYWFEKLAACHPEAFVFLVSVPGVMVWMGATPEVFLEQTPTAIRTMALAGTRPAGDKGEWGGKEIEEQAIVADYIAGQVGEIGDWEMKGPFSKKAGKVEHLCTTFTMAKRLPVDKTDRLRSLLHPTPAVGGFPVEQAIRMIAQIEGGDRRYYAGYVGPIHADGTFHWYVNLRSMEVFPDAVRLYIGGGITALSDPEKEWEETKLKSQTLLDVIM